MTRKTISLFALTLLLATGLAFAVSEPAAAPAVQAAPADQPVQLDLTELFGEDSCAPQPASVKPGCSRTCKNDRDCPYYPEQVCGGGCCVF